MNNGRNWKFLNYFGFSAASLGILSMNRKSILADIDSTKKPPLLSPIALEPHGKVFFPLQLEPNGAEEGFELVGLGVRQVTFLNFNAYSLAFYIGKSTVERLKSTSRWLQEFSIAKWNQTNAEGSNFFLKDLVGNPKSHIAIMISPVRPTDGSHLRNGFIRMLQSRFEKEKARMSSKDQLLVQEGLSQFKTLFSSSLIPKGTRILFKKSGAQITCHVDEKVAGSITNPYIASWFFEGYLMGQHISPSLVSSCATGLYKLFE